MLNKKHTSYDFYKRIFHSNVAEQKQNIVQHKIPVTDEWGWCSISLDIDSLRTCNQTLPQSVHTNIPK